MSQIMDFCKTADVEIWAPRGQKTVFGGKIRHKEKMGSTIPMKLKFQISLSYNPKYFW